MLLTTVVFFKQDAKTVSLLCPEHIDQAEDRGNIFSKQITQHFFSNISMSRLRKGHLYVMLIKCFS